MGKRGSVESKFSKITTKKPVSAGSVVEIVKFMPYLSEILLQKHDIESFAGLVAEVRKRTAGELFLHMDIKPPFPDTPDNWEDVLEAAFTGVSQNSRDD